MSRSSQKGRPTTAKNGKDADEIQDLGPWKYVEGGRPHQVIVEERQDRNNRLVIRWWIAPVPVEGQPDSPVSPGRWQKVFLDSPHPRTVRDSAGALEPTSKAKTKGLAIEVYLALRQGRDPMPIVSPFARPQTKAPPATTAAPAVVAQATPTKDEAPQAADTPPSPTAAPVLSISQGLALAFPVDEKGKLTGGGLYSAVTRHAREARAAADKARKMVEKMFTKDCGWDVLKPSTWRDLGVRLLEDKRPLSEAVAKAPGVRSTELAIAELAAAARWLLQEGHLATVTQPARRWRTALQMHFTAVTNLGLAPARPRHTVEEAGKLYRTALDLSNACDPRIRLVVRLGLELRAGQVLRVRRSALNLEPVGAFGMGTLTVVGSGKKKGATLDLTPEDREGIDWALSTYLGQLEKAFLCGKLPDYYLVPGRTLNENDEAPVRKLSELRPLGRRQALVFFRELEKIAKVKSVEGRGWYGLRRLGSDLVEQATTDEGVRVGAGGWTGSRMRRDYLNPDSPEVKAKIAKVRRKVRRGLAKAPVRPHTSPKAKKSGDVRTKRGA